MTDSAAELAVEIALNGCEGECEVDKCLAKSAITDEFSTLHIVINLAMCTKGVITDLSFIQEYTEYSATDRLLDQMIQQIKTATVLRRLLHDDASKQ